MRRREQVLPGMRAYHPERGTGIVGDCSDYQYCYFEPDDGSGTAFVCKSYLSEVR